MAFKPIASASVAVPRESGHTSYIRVGTLLEADSNDPSKGLPYVLILDSHINLAELCRLQQRDGVAVSFYHFSPRGEETAKSMKKSFKVAAPNFDDDIPF